MNNPSDSSSLPAPKTIVCPCCGAEFAGEMRQGCPACGAYAVGEPLVAPARQLPRLGRAAFAFLTGVVLLSVLLVGTLIELMSGAAGFGFWTVIAAAETIAWRTKSALLPASIVAAYLALRFAVRARAAIGEPAFGGKRFARAGVAMSAAVACSVILLVGVTIPERLRQREVAREAARESLKYAVQSAFMRYQIAYGTLPAEFGHLRRLNDDDGTIARVLANFDEDSYAPSSVQAVARSPKSRAGRNARTTRVRPVAYRGNANDAASTGGLTFTNYDIVWAGEDRIIGTADDRLIRDGEFVNAPRRTPSTMATPRDTGAKTIMRGSSR